MAWDGMGSLCWILSEIHLSLPASPVLIIY